MLPRRTVLSRGLTLIATLLASPHAAMSQLARPAAALKIGIIGTGRIGGALAEHWVNAGHEVFMSSRHPEDLQELAQMLGPRAHAGTPAEAAAFGDVILVSVPYAALPQIGVDYASSLRGKVVLDTSNPVERRDGAMAIDAQRKGSGIASAELLPGTRLVRAFNCIPADSLRNDGNHAPERYAIPLAGDDAEALSVAQRLVGDAGFDGVVVGNLESARLFDLGQPLASELFTATELRAEIAALK